MVRSNKPEIRNTENGFTTTDEFFGTEDRTNETIKQNTNETGTGNTSRDTSGTTEAELNPPKRQRGRPKGSTNKNKETISLQEEERVTGKSKYSGKKEVRFLTKEEAQKTTEFLLSTVNDLAVNFIDKEAALNAIENSLLAMSLPEYLTSIELSKLEQGSKILYPIMGLAGLTLYSLRVSNIILEKRKQEKLRKQQLEPFQENNVNPVSTPQAEPEQNNSTYYPNNPESEPEWTAANLNKQNISKALHPF